MKSRRRQHQKQRSATHQRTGHCSAAKGKNNKIRSVPIRNDCIACTDLLLIDIWGDGGPRSSLSEPSVFISIAFSRLCAIFFFFLSQLTGGLNHTNTERSNRKQRRRRDRAACTHGKERGANYKTNRSANGS